MAQNGSGGGGAAAITNKKILASIKDATCASDEDIQFMLAECDGDVNEAVSRLLDSPFEQVQTKKDRRVKAPREERRDGPPPRGDRRDGGQRTMEVKRPGYGGDRGERGGPGRGGRGGRGDRDRPGPGPGPAPGRGPPGPKAPGLTAPKPVQPVPLPAQAPRPAETSSPVPQPPPIRSAGAGTSFTDILRGTASMQPASPAPAAPTPAASPAAMQAPVAESAPAASAPMPSMTSGQTFAEKLAASQGALSAKTEAQSMTSLPSHLSSYQPATASSASAPSDLPPATSAWGAPGAKPADPAPIPASSLAGLLSSKTDEDKSVLSGMPGATSSAADALGLQFGQFGMGGAGMGDFGAGFGSGFGAGDDLSGRAEQVSAPSPAAPKAPEPETTEDNSAAGFQATASYGYGQATANAMASLGQAPPAPEPVSAPASAAVQASQLPTAQYYGAQAGYQFGGQDLGGYQYGQGPSKADDPATSAPGASKYSVPSQRQDSTVDPPTSSAASVSGGPAAAAPPAQPVVPQMPAYPNHMPPGMAAQYGYMPQYPYMHNANMYMYPNPYPHYTGAAGYPPQAGNTNFPPSVGSSSYPSQVPSGGPMKYSYPYAQSSQAPPSSGLAPGGYSYSNPSGYGADESGSGAGAGYGKDAKDSLYGATSNQQGAPQMVRDSPYAGYNMPGQGYQQQGYSAGGQGQYGNSAYAQYMQSPYALGGQMPPPNMGGQGGSGGQSNSYKLQ